MAHCDFNVVEFAIVPEWALSLFTLESLFPRATSAAAWAGDLCHLMVCVVPSTIYGKWVLYL